jgi:hypothetical protein
MANIAGAYDPNAEPGGDFDPIPAGDYRAKIIESDIEDVSSRNNYGRCLKLTWQIETGPYDGRLVWQRLNMWAEGMNNLDKVISIAQSQFAAIRQATGKIAPQDSSELHHIPCMIRVKVKTDSSGQYSPSNEVTSVKPVDGAPAGANGAVPKFAAPQQSAPANSSGGSAPWRKSA